jgi:hypothetical protein
MSKIWFITGVSRGFGRQFTEAALERRSRPPPRGTASPWTTTACASTLHLGPRRHPRIVEQLGALTASEATAAQIADRLAEQGLTPSASGTAASTPPRSSA